MKTKNWVIETLRYPSIFCPEALVVGTLDEAMAVVDYRMKSAGQVASASETAWSAVTVTTSRYEYEDAGVFTGYVWDMPGKLAPGTYWCVNPDLDEVHMTREYVVHEDGWAGHRAR